MAKNCKGEASDQGGGREKFIGGQKKGHQGGVPGMNGCDKRGVRGLAIKKEENKRTLTKEKSFEKGN